MGDIYVLNNNSMIMQWYSIIIHFSKPAECTKSEGYIIRWVANDNNECATVEGDIENESYTYVGGSSLCRLSAPSS